MSGARIKFQALWSERCLLVEVGPDLIAGHDTGDHRQLKLALLEAKGTPFQVQVRRDYLDASKMSQSGEAELTQERPEFVWELPRGCESSIFKVEQYNKKNRYTSTLSSAGSLGQVEVRRRALPPATGGYRPQVKRASKTKYPQAATVSRSASQDQWHAGTAGQSQGSPPSPRDDVGIALQAGFNQVHQRLDEMSRQVSSLSERLQPEANAPELEALRRQLGEESRRAASAEQQLAQSKRGEAAWKQRVGELTDKHQHAASRLTDTQAQVQRLRENTTAAAAEPLQKVLQLLRGQTPDGASDPLSSDEVGALKEALTRVQDKLADAEARGHVDKVLSELATVGDDPIERACAMAESGDVVGALRLAEQFLLNPPDASTARGRDAYSNLLRGLVRNLWRSQGAREFLARREWIDQALRVLGFDLLVPEVGKTFSHRLQQATDKVPVAEGQARNSIVEVREPGFKDLDGNIVELAKVVIAKG